MNRSALHPLPSPQPHPLIIDLPHGGSMHAHPDLPSSQILDTEWLLTNGRGSFLMGSVAGTNTRRYHSLLTVSQRPPVERLNLLNNLADAISFNGVTYDLATFEFASPGGGSVFHPKGFTHIRRFEKDLSVRWTYHCGPIRVIKSLELLWGRDVAVLSYRIEPLSPTSDTGSHTPDSVTLTLQPLVALRDFHHQRRALGFDPFTIHQAHGSVSIAIDGLLPLWITPSDAQFTESRGWWYNFRRRRESDRSQDDIEDLLCPGTFTTHLHQVDRQVSQVSFTFSTEQPTHAAHHTPPSDHGSRANLIASHVAHLRKQIGPSTWLTDEKLWTLAAAANDFVVTRMVDHESMTTILAGYPWFADWGRDTMISLPGLLLTTGRFDEARRTLAIYARHIRRGLVPNRFDDYGGEPHYNTVDAPMWFIHAALEYLRLTGDQETWRATLAPACNQIIHCFQRGTDGPIHMDTDGLIVAGDPYTQLTWMDAKRDGVVFTPRHGKAVEINALWYRALTGCSQVLAGLDDALAADYAKLAAKVKKSFNALFWSDDLGHLFDHVTDGRADPSFRPNQLIAVSLPESPLSQPRQKQIIAKAREKLLTPVGLRTLPTTDPNYHANYGGSMFDRDKAYHQGTIWPWLIGPFIEGSLRAAKFSSAARKQARADLDGLLLELDLHSVGQLHEVYSPSPPHRPEGCIAQAWSVAELLRTAILVETEER